MKLFAVIITICICTSFSTAIIVQSPLPVVTYSDSLQAERDKYLEQLRIAIRGKEQLPVDSVFTNLKVFGGFPAENLLLAMNSWSRALGVSCQHCHVSDEWALDDKEAKEVARQMSAMTTTINSKLLPGIKGLKRTRPVINCTSCHNGNLRPALRMVD